MEPARVRIESHRLMRTTAPRASVRVDDAHRIARERTDSQRTLLRERTKLHAAIFLLSFVFATGVATLGILVFVRTSENLLRLVLTGIASAGCFVGMFAWLRFFILSHPRWAHMHSQEDEEEPHTTKSVAYGFVALAVALLLAGVIMKTASASTIL